MLSAELSSSISLLVKACFCDRAVASAAGKLTAESLRNFGASYVQAYVFGCFEVYWNKYHELPMMAHVQDQLVAFHGQLLSPGLEPHKEELEQLSMSIIQGFKEPISVKFFGDLISQIYKSTIGNQLVSVAATEAIATGEYDLLADEVNKVRVQSSAARRSYSAFSKKKANKLTMLPVGIPWIDTLFGGAFRKGNSYGILAPTGGGKTTLAGQIGVLAALSGVKVALVLTEQSVDEPEFIDRFWALITNKPSRVFSQYESEDDFPADLVTDDHRATREKVDKALRVYDFAREPGDLETIRSIAAGMDGFKPDIVILDWAGKLATQMIEQGHRAADNETNALKYIATGMNEIAITERVASVVFHQLRSDCDSPMSRYSHTDANNCKQFCNTLAYGTVLHPKDDNNVLLIHTTKGRWTERAEQIVKLRGELAQFVPLTGYMRGRGRWEREADAGKMPDEPSKKKAGANYHFSQGMA